MFYLNSSKPHENLVKQVINHIIAITILQKDYRLREVESFD